MLQRKKTTRAAGSWRRIGAVAIALASAVLVPSPEAQTREVRKTHIVGAGQSVAEIADYYGVSQRDLREINGLEENDVLRVGQELQIPNVLRVSGVIYTVKNGDTLASIAAEFDRSARQIAEANKIAITAGLPVGKTLVIPDKNATPKRIEVAGRKIKPIVFLRVRTGERETLELYSKDGELNRRNVMRLSYLAREKNTNKVKRLNARLAKMLELVAEKFPDKAIEIISGYRANDVAGEESQHAFGRALDFKISGVPTIQIYRFCQTLPRSGCGLYPNSGFMHMDAREKNATWVK